MRVVIAGSTGLIGTTLVALLRHAGHDVLRLVRRPARAPDERAWDPPAATMDAGTMEGVDAVVNLCGSALGNRSIGTGALGGMLVGVVLGVFIIPVLFVIFQYLQEKIGRKRRQAETPGFAE